MKSYYFRKFGNFIYFGLHVCQVSAKSKKLFFFIHHSSSFIIIMKMGRGVVGSFRLGTAGLVSFPLYFFLSLIFPSFHSFSFFRFFLFLLSLFLFSFFYFIFLLLLKYRTCKTSVGVGLTTFKINSS